MTPCIVVLLMRSCVYGSKFSVLCTWHCICVSVYPATCVWVQVCDHVYVAQFLGSEPLVCGTRSCDIYVSLQILGSLRPHTPHPASVAPCVWPRVSLPCIWTRIHYLGYTAWPTWLSQCGLVYVTSNMWLCVCVCGLGYMATVLWPHQ